MIVVVECAGMMVGVMVSIRSIRCVGVVYSVVVRVLVARVYLLVRVFGLYRQRCLDVP